MAGHPRAVHGDVHGAVLTHGPISSISGNWNFGGPPSIIITHDGRLKRVHYGTERESEWTEPDFQDAPLPSEDGIIFKIRHRDRRPIDARVSCDYAGSPCFKVISGDAEGRLEANMAICFQPGKSLSPLQDGDIVVAVDGNDVGTVEEYEELIAGASDFVVTVLPANIGGSRLEHVAQATGTTAIEFDIQEALGLEDDVYVQVPLRRIGDSTGRIEWKWTAQNGDVVPEIFATLKHHEGTVVFEEGVRSAVIEAEIPKDKSWNIDSVYYLKLDESPMTAPDGMNIFRGDNDSVPIYSVNTVSFPGGAFGRLRDKGCKKPSMTEIIKGFLYHNFTAMRRETIQGFAWCTVPPLLLWVGQLNFQMLIDCGLIHLYEGSLGMPMNAPGAETCQVLGVTFESSAGHILLVVMVLRIVFQGCEFIAALMFKQLRLGGKAERLLRVNMFSTMLQLSVDAQEAFDDGDIPKTMDSEVDAAVDKVWMQCFTCYKAVLGAIVRVALCINIISKASITPWCFGCLFLMFVLGLACAKLRGKMSLRLHRMTLVKDENWASFVHECNSATGPILSYKRGPAFNEEFANLHTLYNAAAYNAGKYDFDTMWWMKHLYELIAAAVLLIGGVAVHNGEVSIGGFLVFWKAVAGFGKDLLSLLKIMLETLAGTAAIKQIAGVLNAETRRSVQVSQNDLSGSDIVMRDVVHRYKSAASPSDVTTLREMTLPAGEMHCFPVRAGSGTQSGTAAGVVTIFQLITNDVLPQSGLVTFPRHWRVIYIPAMPVMFDGTLFYNLTFAGWQYPREVVWEVCRACGMSENLLGKDDFDVGHGGYRMRFSDSLIVCIVRAMLADVDMLMISSALDVLGNALAVKVLRRLRLYIAEKGLPGARLPHEVRHVKTVLYSSKFQALMDEATCYVCGPKDDEMGPSAKDDEIDPSSKATARCCPAGHELRPHTTKGGHCDGCGVKCPAGEKVMYCRSCNWYLCNRCYPQELEKSPACYAASL